MKKLTIEIHGNFGSKFQERFAAESLYAALKAWRSFINNGHKNTWLEVDIEGEPLEILNWIEFRKKQPMNENPKPTAEEIKAARAVLNRERAINYWEEVKSDPERYKERLKQVREASKVAARLRQGKV